MARRRDIFMARIFYSESSDSKKRPCIIMSSEKYHETGFALVVPITHANDDYCIPIEENDVTCLLEKYSTARSDYLIRIRNEQLLYPIGKISTEFHQKLVEKMIELIKG